MYMFMHIGRIEVTAQVTVYGEMLKSFDKSCAADVIIRINHVAADVNVSGELRELIDEYIAVGIAPGISSKSSINGLPSEALSKTSQGRL